MSDVDIDKVVEIAIRDNPFQLDALTMLIERVEYDFCLMRPQRLMLLLQHLNRKDLVSKVCTFFSLYLCEVSDEIVGFFVHIRMVQFVMDVFKKYFNEEDSIEPKVIILLSVLASHSYTAALEMDKAGLPEDLCMLLREGRTELSEIADLISYLSQYKEIAVKFSSVFSILLDFVCSANVEESYKFFLAIINLIENCEECHELMMNDPRREEFFKLLDSNEKIDIDVGIQFIGAFISHPMKYNDEFVRRALISVSPFLHGDDVMFLKYTLKFISCAAHNGPLFVQVCIDMGIVKFLIEQMRSDHKWCIKLHFFEAIFCLLAYAQGDQLYTFLEHGLMKIAIEDFVEMISTYPQVYLAGMTNLFNSTDDNVREEIAYSPVVDEKIRKLTNQDDAEIRQRAIFLINIIEAFIENTSL